MVWRDFGRTLGLSTTKLTKETPRRLQNRIVGNVIESLLKIVSPWSDVKGIMYADRNNLHKQEQQKDFSSWSSIHWSHQIGYIPILVVFFRRKRMLNKTNVTISTIMNVLKTTKIPTGALCLLDNESPNFVTSIRQFSKTVKQMNTR